MRNLTTKVRGCVLGVVLALTSMAGFADGTCNTGPVLCCNSIQLPNSPTVVTVAGILGINLGNVTGLVGLTCYPITAGGGANCSAQAVCCTGNLISGAIALGCTPVDIPL